MFQLSLPGAAVAAVLSIGCCFGTAAADSSLFRSWFDHGASNAASARYVFLFIGDGMASPQIHATEAYLAALQTDDAEPGEVKAVKLHMSQLPYQGMQMSYANDRLITGSAAAGTALACGMKTNIGVISMNPDATEPCTTLAEAAKAKGMRVGIVSSVSIDHATPAVYYAHQPSRNNYEQIDFELLNSDFDYFGGGGFRVNKWKSEAYAEMSNEERYQVVEQIATENGFVYADTREEFEALQPPQWRWRGTRAIAVNPYLDGSNAIPYALNRESGNYPGSITLAEFTAKGIELLDNPRGFFMMVEGGKIDWAAHANDARAVIDDTLAFDDAVAVALEFAQKHPRDTLIVVTGDHECGGMTLGFAGTAYDTYYEMLQGQTIAYDAFENEVLADYVARHDPAPEDIDDDMWRLIFDHFGLDCGGLSEDTADDLTDYEKSLLEDAFDKTVHGENVNTEEENNVLYGYYDPLTVTITHVLNKRAGLAFTSYSHTAVPVPVLAQGAGASRFDGYYDNTDVAKKIADAMNVKIGQ